MSERASERVEWGSDERASKKVSDHFVKKKAQRMMRKHEKTSWALSELL